MALATNQLYSETTRGPLPRIEPAKGPGAVTVRTFAGVTGATLPIGCPCYVEAATGLLKKIVPGANAATNLIFVIVWPAPRVLAATGSAHLGAVMEKGSLHHEGPDALRAAGTLAGTAQQLKDNCRQPSNRERGIVIEGLTLIGGDAGLTG